MTKKEQLVWLREWYDEHRAELQTQPAMVSAIKADQEVENRIHDLYLSIFNKSLGGCGSCLADALVEMYHFPISRVEEMDECKFKLKRGVLLQDPTGLLPHVTTANITNELALAYLKDNPERRDLFDELPENIETLLLSGDNEPEEQQVTQAPKRATRAKKTQKSK